MLSLIGRCRDGKGRKCDRDGVMRLVGPDGLVVPGVTMCREHAEECIREYAAKLGEHWTMLDVRTDERIDIMGPGQCVRPVDPLEDAHNRMRLAADILKRGLKDTRAWSTSMEEAIEILEGRKQ